ncbi:MAG: PSD1 and planctomycete cytochrome C domain-containing protein [Planctomycetales bacterium]
MVLFGLLAGGRMTPGAFAANPQPTADTPTSTPEQEAFFEKSVRPILVARCFECHGEKKQAGGLRLDSREGALKGGDGGVAVVAGKPEESRLVEVIRYSESVKMPPKGKLPDAEIDLLTEWIRQGVPFPASPAATAPALGHLATPEGIDLARSTHWALQPIGRPEPPPVVQADWIRSTVDRFILEKLEATGVSPSPPADRYTLLRRVTFDLIGLPPTAAEVVAFETDPSPDAYAAVVDRLLASPQYGERWGRHWLDLARYADTKGYVFTEERKYPFSYTYRDYVIRAFNDDLPFDRFILEQLAADQLPLGEDKTPLAAMGFLTLGRRFGNNQHDIIDDRIDVVTRGLLGLTVSCARCHDHKYDPIPTSDYYSLYGVFASSIEPADLPQIGPAADGEAYQTYLQELQTREAAVEQFVTEKLRELADDLRGHTGDYLAAVVKYQGQELPDERGRSLGRGEVRIPIVRRWREFLEATAKSPHPVFGPWHALAALPSEGFPAAATALIASLNDAADAQPRTNRLVKQALSAAAPQSMADVAAIYGKLLVGVHEDWVKLSRTPASGEEAAAASQGEATPNQPAKPATGVAPTSLPDPAAEELRQVLYAENNPTQVPRDGTRRLFDRATNNKISELKKAVDSLKANSPAAPPRAMVLHDAPQPVNPQILIRGNPGRPGNSVPRQFLQVLSPKEGVPFQQGSGRLELARAITSPHNPLTARVLANRVWMHHMGRGLVSTPSDFGTRGTPPSHPELLDHLAAALIQEGWSLKSLHRRIVLSAVYQQASDDRSEAFGADPDNRLYWKMPRKRLEFEPQRDALLAVGGRLDTSGGGHPVDLFAAPFTPRRAVYGFIDRQDLPGTLRVFDFASPDVSTAQRPQTTVPQQALFGMNSPFVIEQAERLAAHHDVASRRDAADKVHALYRLVFARRPEPAELAVGVAFLAEVPGDSGDRTTPGLSLLAQYAQALLLANEFVFVD